MTALSSDDETPNSELAPRRLIDGGAGERERRLLASARLDRVPASAKARVTAALGGVLEPHATPGAPPNDGPSRAPADARPRFGGRSGLGVIGAGLVGAIALSLWLQSGPRESSNAGPITGGAFTPSPAPMAGAAHQRASGTAVALDTPPPLPEPAELPRPGLEPPATPARPARPHPARAKQSTPSGHADAVESGLLAEVRALEAVSAAIAAGEAQRAARELAGYRHRFPRGELAIEADVLAIQIAAASGDGEAASAGAGRLLARPEAAHYHARVRALLGGPGMAAGSTAPENVAPHRSNDAATHIRARR